MAGAKRNRLVDGAWVLVVESQDSCFGSSIIPRCDNVPFFPSALNCLTTRLEICSSDEESSTLSKIASSVLLAGLKAVMLVSMASNVAKQKERDNSQGNTAPFTGSLFQIDPSAELFDQFLTSA